ncbi:hypothetical protein [Bradyrhizobium acaciae]|uniref:hypothetical protein n=1 Tax=Bradyrhizobium acaciae TaxID=2683706 RepID=UPI001E43D2CA|nr:hypothetical protein [Bradyrhizobium acaciae]MCC8978311.1 hypothetical protein [Bradyrhizobium acaciae]
MNQKSPLLVNVVNPDAFSGKGSIIVVEYSDPEAAMRAAKKIAEETGRTVTVRDENMNVLGTIPKPTAH